MLTYEEAEKLFLEWTPSGPLRLHGYAVGHVMGELAPADAADVMRDRYRIVGVLHDADYAQWPESHPTKIVAWLRSRGEDEAADAIAGHYTKWGGDYARHLNAAIVAADELTGFIMAVAKVNPRGIAGVETDAVLRKLKDKSFCRSVDREEVKAGASLLGVPLADHVQRVTATLLAHAAALGLEARV